jgi:aspartate/methionine/tyrosine aminotransferase
MRLSKRLHWDAPENEIATRAKTELDLTVSNPTLADFQYPPALYEALADPRTLQYAPDPRGMATVRELVGADLLTASSSESYSYLFKLLCDAGDEVLVPRPSYPLFEYLARLDCVNIRQYPLFYDHGWHIDTGALRAMVSPQTRAIVVVNPNNPTGSFLKRSEWMVFEEIGLPVIADEVFAPYPLVDCDRLDCVAEIESPLLRFSLGGLSKQAGLPQMKLGWIRIGACAERDEALRGLEWIADTYLSVSAPVQHAAHMLLRSGVHRQILERVRANHALVPEALATEGGWSVMLRLPATRTEDEWVAQLHESGVGVQPGYFFDMDSHAPHIVLSLLTPTSRFQEGLRRVRAAIARSVSNPGHPEENGAG